ncbi:MAG: hypothetical protein KGH69_03165 [Candidatus Micrarchaeota archaeon]|nr:hypothetical protein [Candidatus Micrarchaeota archaeon]
MDLNILAYTAGFFDAEGSITLKKFETNTNPRYQIDVRLSSQNKTVLYEIKKYFSNKGSIRSKSDNKSVLELVYTAKHALYFLQQIEPFLILKKHETNLAIKFEKTLVRIYGHTLPSIVIYQREQMKNEMAYIHKNRGKFGKIDKKYLLPYFAGLVDGDGYIGILHKNTLTLTVVSKYQKFLTYLYKQISSGFITPNSNAYHWTISSKGAKVLLQKITPYLIIKKPEANLAITFQSSINSLNRRPLDKKTMLKRQHLIESINKMHLGKGQAKYYH